MRLLLAGGLLVGAIAVASAFAIGEHITIGPPNIVVQNGQGSASLTAHNDGTVPIDITGISQTPSCSMTGGTAITASFANFPTNMFTFTNGDNQPITQNCPASPPLTTHGIARCQFSLDNAVGPLVDFTTICLYQTTPTLTATGLPVQFGTIGLGSADMRTFEVTSSVAVTGGLYYSVVDGEGNYAMVSPCIGGPHCYDNMPLAANTPRMVTVACSPQRSGNVDAVMHVVSDTGLHLTAPVQLQCNGGAAAAGGDINLSTNTVTLSQPVNGGPATATVMLQNTSMTDPLTVQSFIPSGSSDWTLSVSAPCMLGTECVVPANSSVTLTLTFDPSTIGTGNDGMILINSDDPDEGMTNLFLQGTGTGTTLNLVTAIGTPPVSIGSSPVGTPTSATFMVENNPATDPLLVLIDVTNDPTFAVDISSATIQPGTMQEITVTCTPPSLGTTTAMFTVMGGATFGSPIQFPVECTGTMGNLSVQPGTISLGDVRIGSSPVVRSVSLSTNGPTLQVTSGPTEQPEDSHVTVSAVNPSQIVMGIDSTFDVTFDPGTVEGPVTTTIDVTAGGSVGSVMFSANVVRAQLAEPAAVNFGSVCVGQTPAAQTLHLVSTGSAKIHLAQRPELEKRAASPFTLTRLVPDDNGYPADLLTNDEATVRVQPKPQTAAGAFSDRVEWTADVPAAPRTPLDIEYVADRGGLSPGALDFGGVEVRQSSERQTLTVQNCSTGTLMLAAPVFNPPGEFTLLDSVPAMLGPNESATLTLVFTPSAPGVRTSRMTIATSAGELAADLNGTGLGDGSTRGAPASLYACDCASSDPVNGFVIVIALVLPLIPRRRRRC